MYPACSRPSSCRTESAGPAFAELERIVRAEGCCASVVGRLFAIIYSRNLHEAIPPLVWEMESRGKRGGRS